MHQRSVDVVVIGAGMAGMGAADHLLRAGKSVALVEATPGVGGLARAIRVGGEPIEPYYHHIFPQDRETLELIERLGLGDRLEWREGPMAVMHAGRPYPFDSPLDLLRFAPLSVPERLRMGVATAVQLVRPDRQHLDRVPASVEARRWFGKRGYDTLWRPLLEAKFGEHADSVAMAWLVARIRQRGGSRKPGGDRLGYLRGSLGTLADAYAVRLVADGADLGTSTRVRELCPTPEGWQVDVEGPDGPDQLLASTVVACVSGLILDRVVELPPAYAAAMRAIPYRGIVCALLELSRPLSAYYWVNVTDRLGLGCVGIIEHTNFIPAERYGGRALVYLAHYVDRDGETWSASPDALIEAVVPAMRALNPAFERDWILDVHVNRDPFAQPVPLVGGPMPELPIETGLPGLFHASLAHVYPDDRGVSKALAVGRRAAEAAERWLAAREARSALGATAVGSAADLIAAAQAESARS
ncbi:MAG: FAD-dependent oxidoreductase [Chloroflexi bacterium]|nr:FAD-dependent oxidoreductase [Chloroflexota bacterium]